MPIFWAGKIDSFFSKHLLCCKFIQNIYLSIFIILLRPTKYLDYFSQNILVLPENPNIKKKKKLSSNFIQNLYLNIIINTIQANTKNIYIFVQNTSIFAGKSEYLFKKIIMQSIHSDRIILVILSFFGRTNQILFQITV